MTKKKKKKKEEKGKSFVYSILPFSFALQISNSIMHRPVRKASGLSKFLNVIWNLSVRARSVSSLHLSGICCLPVCQISRLLSEFKTHLKIFSG